MSTAIARVAMVAAAAAAIACGSSKQEGGGGGAATSGPRTFTIALDPGDPPVTLTVAIPSSWQLRGDPKQPDWTLPALDGKGLVSIAALAWSGDPTTWVAKSLRMQYDEAAQAKAVREDLPQGRVWMQAPEDDGRVHARLFIPFDRGVVMGVAMITDPDGTQLPAIRAVWETIQIAPTTAK